MYFLYTEKSGNNSSSLNEHDNKAARIFGLLPVSTINRNKIKIQQLSRPTSPSLHNENDITNSSIQKTSIKIDTDSSSTVNVNDNVNLYHSSVLIHNNAHHIDKMNKGEQDEQLNSENKILNLYPDRSDCHFTKNTKTAIAILCANTNEQNQKKDQLQGVLSKSKNDSKTLISLNDSVSEYIFSKNVQSLTHERTEDDNNSDNNSNHNLTQRLIVDSFVLKLLNDPCLSHLLRGLEVKAIANIIENSLTRIPINKFNFDIRGRKNFEIDKLLLKQLHHIIKEERCRIDMNAQTSIPKASPEKSTYCNLTSSTDDSKEECEIIPIRKICEMISECSLNKNIDSLINFQSDHQYESISLNYDPIYEEINEEPPPLPINPPPLKNESPDKHHKSMFLGATKYDILSYLVDAKDRIDPEEQILSYTYKFLQRSVEDTAMENVTDKNGKIIKNTQDRCKTQEKCAAIERNDSGVGSETSKSSRTKYLPGAIKNVIPPIHLCEDCGKIAETI